MKLASPKLLQMSHQKESRKANQVASLADYRVSAGHDGPCRSLNSRQDGRRHNQRGSRACEGCRRMKVRCDQNSTCPEAPCSRCVKTSTQCITRKSSRKRRTKSNWVVDLNDKFDALIAALHQRNIDAGANGTAGQTTREAKTRSDGTIELGSLTRTPTPSTSGVGRRDGILDLSSKSMSAKKQRHDREKPDDETWRTGAFEVRLSQQAEQKHRAYFLYIEYISKAAS